MRFAFSDDQLLFRDTVRDFLQKECGAGQVRYAWVDGDGQRTPVWAGLVEMGVVGLTVPEAQGGLGMNELDLVLLLEETGRVALPEPIVETTAVVAPLLAELVAAGHDHPPTWLAGIAGGDLIAGAAFGDAAFVASSDVAGLFVLGERHRVVALPSSSVRLEPQASVDGSRHLARVHYEPGTEIVLAEGPAADAVSRRALDRGALGTAAQLVGLADHLLATTVEYVKQREQFGVAIGSFQAIKHHLADTLLAIEFARPVVYRAACSMAVGDPEASRHVSMAKCYASDAATLAARHALQCHGAIGYTVEYDLHLWLKRVWALTASWGDAAHHRERVAAALLDSSQ